MYLFLEVVTLVRVLLRCPFEDLLRRTFEGEVSGSVVMREVCFRIKTPSSGCIPLCPGEGAGALFFSGPRIIISLKGLFTLLFI